ncbi:serine dehydratase subunit alpha family protein [Alicyclobacillaceae bacterium I2511]|jgi:L-cysteine desulfidase|nr:serine dehydratase subunit alpha family protein [Alicyclobacillaceae bacterium I2511]
MRDFKILVEILKDQVKPAMGCTEPVAVAWAVARARHELSEKIRKVTITVSLNLFKNGMGVVIPGTNEMGLEMAAAIGAIGGDPNLELGILESIQPDEVEEARHFLRSGNLNLRVDKKRQGIYIDCLVESMSQTAEVVVEGGHTRMIQLYRQGELVWQESPQIDSLRDESDLIDWTLQELRQSVEKIPISLLRFLADGIEMNIQMGKNGLEGNLGLKVGATLQQLVDDGILAKDVVNEVKILAAAAADARMSGSKAMVMSSGGSGNQGIVVTIPIAVMARRENWSEDILLRALALGHLVNIWVKGYTGKLAAVCGSGIAAGVGAGVGLAWGYGGNDDVLASVVKNIVGNLAGMVCDGAKGGCALKVATSCGEAIISAQLALRGVSISSNDGIVGRTAEDTMNNLGILVREGMENTDKVILDIMLNK